MKRVVAQLPWRQNITLLTSLRDAAARLWYAERALSEGWSQPVLALQIDQQAHARHEAAIWCRLNDGV